MPLAFRPILPKMRTPSTNADAANAVPNTVQSIYKNSAPCANCSSAQQACLIHPPYSPTLCKKCAREHRDKCPAHMHRTDAVIWKKLDIGSRQAGGALASNTQIPAPMEDPSNGGTGNIVLALPEITQAAIFPLQEGAGLNADDMFEPLVSAFAEDFSISTFTDNDPTPDQNNDELMFSFNDLDQQYDLSAIFTVDDNSQDLIRLTESDIEPHVSAFLADFVHPQFTDNIPTPEPNNNEMAFNFNDLDQQFDFTAMFPMDENFGQDFVSPSEDDLQYLNNNFDELWDEFE